MLLLLLLLPSLASLIFGIILPKILVKVLLVRGLSFQTHLKIFRAASLVSSACQLENNPFIQQGRMPHDWLEISQLTIFPPCRQDTLRDCDQESTCYNTVISPIYFVSFVLTAQFVLVNVVIAVLMKHLEESNKEAKEEAELEAELEMEMKTIAPGQHPSSDLFAWTGGNGGDRPESPKGSTNPMQIKVDSQLSLFYPMVRISGGGWRGGWLAYLLIEDVHEFCDEGLGVWCIGSCIPYCLLSKDMPWGRDPNQVFTSGMVQRVLCARDGPKPHSSDLSPSLGSAQSVRFGQTPALFVKKNIWLAFPTFSSHLHAGKCEVSGATLMKSK